MKQKTHPGLKIISYNRKASFNYSFKEFYEAGIVLSGSEVKSLRAGKVSIGESYAFDHNEEIFLVNSNIPSYKESSYNDHNPIRNRKLLLNKKEINKLMGRLNREGFTLIPTKIYFKKGKAKIEIAVAKGKKEYDKRRTKKKRDWDRDKARFFRKTS
jgi:SsrA-binding protein